MWSETLTTTVLPAVLNIAAVGLTALIGQAAVYAKRKWNIDIEASQREALHSAIMSGVRSALLNGATKSQATLLAVAYAKSSVPDAIKSLKPNDNVLLDLAASKIEQLSRA